MRKLLVLPLVLLLAACGSSKSSPGSDKSEISLGLVQGQDFTHAIPAQVAAAKGIFTQHGHAYADADGYSYSGPYSHAIAHTTSRHALLRQLLAFS